MDFEWLGVGSVRCGFVINGQYIICHTFENANQIANVYMTTATLPIRYEIENTGATASASSMKQICSSVMSEGGYSAVVAPSLARRTTILSSIGTTFVPLVSIRLKASRTGAVVLPYLINCLPTSTANYEFALVKNATLTSASWNNTSSPNVEFDVASTSMTGGTIVQSDFVSSSNQSAAAVTGPTGYNYDLQLGATVGGTSDIYTLGVRVLSGSSGDAIGSIAFYDLTRGG
jgi:hypothetical protein